MKIYFNAYDKIATTNLDQIIALSVKASGGAKDTTTASLHTIDENRYKLCMVEVDFNKAQPVVLHTRTIVATDIDEKFEAIPYLTATKPKLIEDEEDEDSDDDENNDKDFVGYCTNCGQPIYEGENYLVDNGDGQIFCSKECKDNFYDGDDDDTTMLCVGCCDNCGKEIYEDDDDYIEDNDGNIFCCYECKKGYAEDHNCAICEHCGDYIYKGNKYIKDEDGRTFCCNSCKKSFYEEEDE